MPVTLGLRGRRLLDSAERTFVGLNPLRRKWLLQVIDALIVRDDAVSAVDWRSKLWSARYGFLPTSYALYDLSANGLRDYVSDFDQETRARGQTFSRALNGQAWPLLRDKLAFHFLCRELGVPTPDVFAVIKQGRPHWVGDHAGPATWAGLRSLIDEQPRVVIKPVSQSFGEGLRFVESSDGGYRINGEETQWTLVEDLLRTLDYFLVSEYVQPAAYASSIFPGTTNTLRLLIVRRRGRAEAHLAGAVHRFGRLRTLPVDNFRHGRGGLSAAIDGSTGIVGRGAGLSDRGDLVWHSHHPDTGAAIEGVRIPRWAAIRDAVMRAADKLSFLPYVGWDVIATESGCVVLEGNDNPGLNSIQVHGPLLADPEARAFFEEEGVVGSTASFVRPEAGQRA